MLSKLSVPIEYKQAAGNKQCNYEKQKMLYNVFK